MLSDAFFIGLSETLKDHITPVDLPTELEAFSALVDKRLWDRASSCPPPRTSFFSTGPMLRTQDTAPHQASPGSRQWLLTSPCSWVAHGSHPNSVSGKCIYCAQTGHLLANCPVRRDRTGSRQAAQLLPLATLTSPSVSLSQPVFIHSPHTHTSPLLSLTLDSSHTEPPKGHLYSMSAPETRTMKAIQTWHWLQASFGSPRPAGAGFFFVEKKG